eukprot:scaffold13058_cov72-Phaeocystis_antarctica.AAC.5
MCSDGGRQPAPFGPFKLASVVGRLAVMAGSSKNSSKNSSRTASRPVTPPQVGSASDAEPDEVDDLSPGGLWHQTFGEALSPSVKKRNIRLHERSPTPGVRAQQAGEEVRQSDKAGRLACQGATLCAAGATRDRQLGRRVAAAAARAGGHRATAAALRDGGAAGRALPAQHVERRRAVARPTWRGERAAAATPHLPPLRHLPLGRRGGTARASRAEQPRAALRPGVRAARLLVAAQVVALPHARRAGAAVRRHRDRLARGAAAAHAPRRLSRARARRARASHARGAGGGNRAEARRGPAEAPRLD